MLYFEYRAYTEKKCASLRLSIVKNKNHINHDEICTQDKHHKYTHIQRILVNSNIRNIPQAVIYQLHVMYS